MGKLVQKTYTFGNEWGLAMIHTDYSDDYFILQPI